MIPRKIGNGFNFMIQYIENWQTLFKHDPLYFCNPTFLIYVIDSAVNPVTFP